MSDKYLLLEAVAEKLADALAEITDSYASHENSDYCDKDVYVEDINAARAALAAYAQWGEK